MPLFGPDVSNHQGQVDWDRAVASGMVDFAIVKASEGVNFVDRWFARNWAELKRLGKPRGAYHYALPSENTPEAEAAHFVRIVRAQGTQPGDLLALDMEDPDFPVGADAGPWSIRFCEAVRSQLGITPLLYTYPSYVPERSLNESGLADYPLWYASYDAPPTAPYPGRVPKPWQIVSLWQYNHNIPVPGIGAMIDMNRFEGTLTAFKNLGGLLEQPPSLRDEVTGFWVAEPFATIYRLPIHGRPLGPAAMYDDKVLRQLFENCVLESNGRGEPRVGGLGQALAHMTGRNIPDWPNVHPNI